MPYLRRTTQHNIIELLSRRKGLGYGSPYNLTWQLIICALLIEIVTEYDGCFNAVAVVYVGLMVENGMHANKIIKKQKR